MYKFSGNSLRDYPIAVFKLKGEVVKVEVDFRDRLPEDVTISSVSVVIKDTQYGSDSTATMLAAPVVLEDLENDIPTEYHGFSFFIAEGRSSLDYIATITIDLTDTLSRTICELPIRVHPPKV